MVLLQPNAATGDLTAAIIRRTTFLAIFQATLAGPSINSTNTAAVYSEDGTTATRLVRTGEDIIALTCANIAHFSTMVQSIL